MHNIRCVCVYVIYTNTCENKMQSADISTFLPNVQLLLLLILPIYGKAQAHSETNHILKAQQVLVTMRKHRGPCQ